jgi:pyruvate,water dikinase
LALFVNCGRPPALIPLIAASPSRSEHEIGDLRAIGGDIEGGNIMVRTKPLDRCGLKDLPQVGGKNASLGEMISRLRGTGVHVPGGFATTADAFWEFLEQNHIGEQLHHIIQAHASGHLTLAETGQRARSLVLHGRLPDALKREVLAAYRGLGRNVSVALRSSATAEDLPDASFAGQQESYLNVRGDAGVLRALQLCLASLFTDRAIAYRLENGYTEVPVALSVGVQRMVRSDKAASGVLFTLDPESGFPGVVTINASWGLGENVVKGRVNPDEFVVFKAGLAAGAAEPILRRGLGAKERRLIYGAGGEGTRDQAVPPALRRRYCLSDREVLALARMGMAIEMHYRRPMDIEWAKDGVDGRLYIVQARPETAQARKTKGVLKTWRLKRRGKVLVSGAAVGDGIVSGPVVLARDPKQAARFPAGGILVAPATDPDWVPIMRKAGAVVTDHGGRTCHAAIVSRELGLPAVVGTGHATRLLKAGRTVTVSCAEGSEGRVYDGALPFEVKESRLDHLAKTRTRLMLNVANPVAAMNWWHLPARGIGLARMEFLVSESIRIHPMALLRWPALKDKAAVREIARLTAGYRDKAAYFVDKLSQGLAQIAVTQYPHPVIVRLSDFKTNEYAGLIGGAEFEPKEENPMIGWRGASRYYSPGYRDGFALECRALRHVRERRGLDNVVVMVPFCRTPEEADKVLAEMARHGLKRGVRGLKVYVMCEIPSNVILAKEFARRFDGFSIGSNDLTQLTLGVDRDSGTLASLFSERHPAVTRFIAQVIREAHKAGAPVGISGQAASDHPDFAAFLVRQGIDSISLNPDSLLGALKTVARQEAALGRRHRSPKR